MLFSHFFDGFLIALALVIESLHAAAQAIRVDQLLIMLGST